MTPRTIPARFARFVMLSGCGWCLDMALFGWGVTLGADPFAANLLSALTAASLVFLASRRLAFARQEGAAAQRSALYALYTLGVILLAGRAIAILMLAMDWMAGRAGLAPTPALAAMLAKVAVTPPQLLANFLVARALAERRWTRAHG